MRVSNGRVVLTGTAGGRRELDRVVGLIEQVSGVRAVDNLTTIDPGARTHEAKLAGRLTRLAASQFPDSRVRVTVFGKVAVLSGKARNPAERRAIERLAENHPRIERTVSKIG